MVGKPETPQFLEGSHDIVIANYSSLLYRTCINVRYSESLFLQEAQAKLRRSRVLETLKGKVTKVNKGMPSRGSRRPCTVLQRNGETFLHDLQAVSLGRTR